MLGNQNGFPLSDTFLESFQPKGRRHDFLKMRASKSRSFEVYDFNGSVTSGAQSGVWTVAAGATATTWATLAEPGGWIRGVTGASVATASLQLYHTNKMFNGTKGAGFASLIRLSAITDIRLEQGFADVLPAVSTTLVNTASAAFNSATIAAVYLYDNGVSASTTVTGLYTVGTSIAYGAVATTTNRYASGVTLFVAMEINGTTVDLWVGEGNRPLARATGALEAASAFLPFISIKGLGASKNVDVDTLWTWTNGRN